MEEILQCGVTSGISGVGELGVIQTPPTSGSDYPHWFSDIVVNGDLFAYWTVKLSVKATARELT